MHALYENDFSNRNVNSNSNRVGSTQIAAVLIYLQIQFVFIRLNNYLIEFLASIPRKAMWIVRFIV